MWFVLKVNKCIFVVANRGDYREKIACPLTKKYKKVTIIVSTFFIHPTPDSKLMNKLLNIFAGNEINVNAYESNLKVG